MHLYYSQGALVLEVLVQEGPSALVDMKMLVSEGHLTTTECGTHNMGSYSRGRTVHAPRMLFHLHIILQTDTHIHTDKDRQTDIPKWWEL